MRVQRPRASGYVNNTPNVTPLRSRIGVSDQLDPKSLDEVMKTGNRLWAVVSPSLVHQPAPIQAGILAQLVSLWLAAYTSKGQPAVAEDMLKAFVSLTRTLTAQNSRILNEVLDRDAAAS
jgi:hypothetical protein